MSTKKWYYKNLNQTLQTSNNSIIPISHYSSPWNIHISRGMYKRQNSCSILQNQIKIIFVLPFFSPLHSLTHHVFNFCTIQYAIHLQRRSMKIQHEKQQHSTILISSNTNQTCPLTPPPLPAWDFQITAPTPFHELPTFNPEQKWQFLTIKLMVKRKVISSRRKCLYKAMAPLHKYCSTCHYWLMWCRVPRAPVNLSFSKLFSHSTPNSLS